MEVCPLCLALICGICYGSWKLGGNKQRHEYVCSSQSGRVPEDSPQGRYGLDGKFAMPAQMVHPCSTACDTRNCLAGQVVRERSTRLDPSLQRRLDFHVLPYRRTLPDCSAPQGLRADHPSHSSLACPKLHRCGAAGRSGMPGRSAAQVTQCHKKCTTVACPLLRQGHTLQVASFNECIGTCFGPLVHHQPTDVFDLLSHHATVELRPLRPLPLQSSK